MPNFQEYSNLYDVIYQDKDYKAEAAYVSSLIKKYRPEAKTVLNLGCGTGKHDVHFAELNYHITGVDLSEGMIAAAKKTFAGKKLAADFLQSDIRSLHLNKKFDVVVSLFHVMSYQITNEDVLNAFKTAKEHLKEDGVFIFDCWYGPGVLSDPPVVRNKKFTGKDLEITRVSTPLVHPDKDMVEVKFELYYKKPSEQADSYFEELHKMRYFFNPELELMLQQSGFRSIECYEWMTNEKPQLKTWNALFTCR